MTDYMKEAERLLEQYDDACLGIIGMSEEQTRAALLAHIQRGAVPEGWKEATIAWEVCASIHREYAKKKDPFFTTRQADFMRHAEAARAAMLAAAPAPDELGDINVVDIAQAADATIETAPAPAGVPMPKPVAYGFGNTAITGHTNRLMMVRIDIPGGDQYAGAFWLPLVLADEAHTYGVACRAAGEAAGYARGLRDAVRDADIEALRLYVRALCKAVDAATDFAGTVAGGASWWDDVWADHAAALDRARERISQAALRGEEK